MISPSCIIHLLVKALYSMCCGCLRRFQCLFFWRNCTFLHLRIDVLKEAFENEETCSQAYVSALSVILTSTRLSSLGNDHLKDLKQLASKCMYKDILRCGDFTSSICADDFACKHILFLDLYLCLIKTISHVSSAVENPMMAHVLPGDQPPRCSDSVAQPSCTCARLINDEIFSFMLDNRQKLEFFDEVWSPFFGNERIVWFQHYLDRVQNDSGMMTLMWGEFSQIVSTINLGQGCTERVFQCLLQTLNLQKDYVRTSLLTNIQPIRLDIVCKMAASLHADSPPNAWRVVNELTRTHGFMVGGNAEVILSTFESLKDKMAADGTRVDGLCRQTRQKQCFPCVVQLYETIFLYLQYSSSFDYTVWSRGRMLVDFDVEMRTTMTKALAETLFAAAMCAQAH